LTYSSISSTQYNDRHQSIYFFIKLWSLYNSSHILKKSSTFISLKSDTLTALKASIKIYSVVIINMLFIIFLSIDDAKIDLKKEEEEVWKDVAVCVIDKVFIFNVVFNDDESFKTKESQYFLLLLWLTFDWCCVDIV